MKVGCLALLDKADLTEFSVVNSVKHYLFAKTAVSL